jgi:hypothetical protein
MVNVRQAVAGRPLLLLLAATACYLYLNLFYLPNIPFLMGGDQVSFWLRGLRMLNHELVYRDFYQFTPPGADVVYFGIFRLLGPHVWVTNLFVLLLGVVLCGVCFSIAGKIMEGRFAALITALFLVCIYCKLRNGTHHWLSVLCVMSAVRTRISHTSWRSTLAVGSLLGCASFFTQTRGVAALLAFLVFLAWRKLRGESSWIGVAKDAVLLAAGFAVAWLALNAYFIQAVGLKQLWYFQVTHVQRHIVGAEGGNLLGLPDAPALRNLPRLFPFLLVYALLVFIYPLSLWRGWRERRQPLTDREPIALLAIVGFFLMVEVAFSPNWLRLYAVSLPAFLLLGWMVSRARKIPRSVFVLCWVALGCIACWQTVSRYVSQPVIVTLPGGAVATTNADKTRLSWFAQRTRPGDFIFQAAWPGVYLPLGLRSPSYLETVVPFDGPRPRDVRNVPTELESKRVPFVIWSPNLNASVGGPDDYLPPLRSYLEACYARVYTFAGGDEAWRRKEQGSCIGTR